MYDLVLFVLGVALAEVATTTRLLRTGRGRALPYYDGCYMRGNI